MKRLALLGLLTALALPGAAEASDFGIDLHAGTLGLGAELNYTVNSFITARLDYNGYNYSHNTNYQQVNYDANLHLKSYGLLLDLHPFAGTFRLSLGYFSNKNALGINATNQSSYTINGDTYSNTELTSLAGAISFKPHVAYFGLGWTTVGTTSTGLGIEFDVGALNQGTPGVKLSATGSVTTQPQFQSDLAQEQTKIQGDLNNFKTYPVIALGLVYRF